MKKATGESVAGADINSPSLPREVSIEIAIWQLRIERAEAHPDHYLPWCQYTIQFMEGWIQLIPIRRLQR